MRPKEYYCITLATPTEEVDFVEGMLYLEGVEGIEETPTSLKAYFKKTAQPLEKFIETLRQKLPSSITLKGEIVKSDATSFQSMAFDPLELIPNVWILPPPDMLDQKVAATYWSNLPECSRYFLVIRPGMAFGTGRHESTQLCAQAIEGLKNPGDKTFLDIGTGSGILAILATKRGFKKVDAVEIDPDARINTLENFALNHVKSIQLFDDIATVKNKYDVVCANIDPPTLSLLHDTLIDHLNPNGELILCGITEGQKGLIVSRFGHLKLAKQIQINEWLMFQFKLV